MFISLPAQKEIPKWTHKITLSSFNCKKLKHMITYVMNYWTDIAASVPH